MRRPRSGDGRKAPLIVFILVAAAVLRVLAARGDLWLDEVWSLALLEDVSSPLQIVTRVRNGNNHIVNSFFLYVLGERDALVYRLPAVLAGIATIGLAVRTVRHRGRRASILVAAFLGFSFLLVQYSSEARGYSFVGLFTILSLRAVQRLRIAPARGDYLLLAGSVAMGFLSHLTFLYFYGSLLVWSAVTLLRERSRLAAIAELARWHTAPLAFLVFLYFAHVRGMDVGGGPSPPYARILPMTLSLAAGGPPEGIPALAAAALVLGLFVLSLLHLRGDPRLPAGLLGGTVLLAPTLMLLVMAPAQIAPRYFYPCVVLLQLSVACLAADALGSAGWRRVAACAAIAVALIGNTWHIVDLVRFGRGSTREAIQFMHDRTTRPRVTIGGDFDWSTKTILMYYYDKSATSKPLAYFRTGDWPARGPEWLIKYGGRDFGRRHPITRTHGHQYVLQKVFPSALLSGGSWFIFRHERSAEP